MCSRSQRNTVREFDLLFCRRSRWWCECGFVCGTVFFSGSNEWGTSRELNLDKSWHNLNFQISYRAMKSACSTKISILVLSLVLCLPGFVIADHIHETTIEEISCEFCTHAGIDAVLDNSQHDFSLPVSAKTHGFSRRVATFTVRLHKHPRGPPLQS